MPKPPTPKLQALIQTEPDLVDRIFDYIFQDPALAAALQAQVEQDAEQDAEQAGEDKLTTLKTAVRAEFKGEECYIAGRPESERQKTVAKVLALFNGRNASEVARKLHIGRASVYRIIKQAGTKR